MATIGLAALSQPVMPMDQSVNEVILLIGLAVGVDYSLFYIDASVRSAPRVAARKPRSRPPPRPPAGRS